ncbi:MAG: pseudouridine-5'-phosphate glycosidase [Gemmatimonadaceae bacterium]|jgi:pseudouridine-5'-phosphate glycosidase|nr:pseudouridine-5'-phosphate glycosidase [Gemmatimonadaceae bacterium]
MLRRLHGIAAAIEHGQPVVALETSVLAQGLPIPHNATAAEAMDRAVREAGALPALTAVAGGVPTLGLTSAELARFLARDGVRKIGARDIAPCAVAGADGATTVAAALALAHAGGVRVFATGGIGGVHRGAPYDESGDLLALARTPLVVTCAGAKSILDLPATLERLETLNVAVVGWGTDELPGFFTRTTGLRIAHVVDGAEAVARMARTQWSLGLPGAILVVIPPPAATALAQAEVDAAVGRALVEAERAGVRGAALTPFLLGAVVAATGGRSLAANLALLEQNARVAGEIAVALGHLA